MLMGRDWRVDTLRGYCIIVMTLAHFDNPLARFTEYTFGYVAAPDGFVFLAGLVSAWVYFRLSQKIGFSAMSAKMFRRVRTIYFCHIALLTLGIVFTLLSGAHSFRASHPLKAFVLGCLLVQQGGFDKILPMYCIYLGFTPLILKQFNQGRAWLIGLISVGLWIGSQFGLGDNTPRIPWMDLGTFNICAWQAFYMAGLYIGYREASSPDFKILKSRALLAVCFVGAALLMIDRHLLWLTGHQPLLGFDGHPNHNAARFLDGALLGYVLWYVPRIVDLKLMPLRLFKFMNYLGQHSLQVFVFSMIITRAEEHTITRLPMSAKLVITILTLLSLAIPAWVHEKYQASRRKVSPPRTELQPQSVS